MQLHRAAALPWRIKESKAERPEKGGPCWLSKQSQMGTYGVQIKGGGSFPGWFVGLVVPVQEIYPALAALKYLFLTAHFFTLCFAIAHQPGQTVVPGRGCLLICVSG